MKTITQFILVALIALFSSMAQAGWTEIQTFEDGTRIYVDKTTAKRVDDIAQVHHLVRWGEPQEDEGILPYRSTIVQTRYDCASKHEKYLASTSYAGPMGDGAEVISDEDEANKWYSISDASMEEKLWTIACSAK